MGQVELELNCVKVYNILTDGHCKHVNSELNFHQDNVTRGHNLKLVNSRWHCGL